MQSPLRPATLVPLERLSLDDRLSGSSGSNRAFASRVIEADDDLAAIRLFLKREKAPGTQRLYEREAERLVLWATQQLGKPLSSLTLNDIEGYRAFLRNPQPAALWCGARAHRDSEDWRPFVGPLSESAVNTALAALRSLFGWLHKAGYLAANPVALLSRGGARVSARRSVERYLDADQWSAFTRAIEVLPADTPEERAAKARARFLSAFLYLLAPRAGELETHTMGSFFEERGHWWWGVLGKGNKEAALPVPDDMLAALVEYRRFLRLPDVPEPHEPVPLLLPLHAMAAVETKGLQALPALSTAPAMTARQLNRLLKDLFARAVEQLPPEHAHKANKLLKASAHWGRHTSITAKVDAGMDLRYVQRDARHKDARTTALYTHEEDERWHAESQKLTLPAPKKGLNRS